MLSWDEKTCCDFVNHMLKYFKYIEDVEQISWLTRIASTDDDTEIRFVVKICSLNSVVVLRIYSDNTCRVREQINFQKLLHQRGIAVPDVFEMVEVRLTEQLNVTAYLEEWIDGIELSDDDFYKYADFLGKLHQESKKLNCSLPGERNHVLYDIQRFESEINTSFHTELTNAKGLIQSMATLMKKTKISMSKLKRYPVHGDYATSNLIKKDKELFLIDFESAGSGYLPEEAGEAFAEIAYSCFDCCNWIERLDEFLFVYKSNVCVSEMELDLIQDVAVIALVIRTLSAEIEEKTKLFLCNDFLKQRNKEMGGV